jgi:hypothetical protein
LLTLREVCNKRLDVYNNLGRPRTITIAAHLSGVFDTSPDEGQTLVCYRRNLFHVGGSILVPSDVDLVSTGSDQKRIETLYAELAAFDTTNGETVTIIALPNAARMLRNPPQQSPPPLQLNFRNSTTSSDVHAFTLDWSRLQFRTATAKTGRTKHGKSQQFFQVSILVKANTEDGTHITLCKARTLPIAVRGRSPKNFRTSKTVATKRDQNGSIKMPESTASDLLDFEPHFSSLLSHSIEAPIESMDTDERLSRVHEYAEPQGRHGNGPDISNQQTRSQLSFMNTNDTTKSVRIVPDSSVRDYNESHHFYISSGLSNPLGPEDSTPRRSLYRYIPLAPDDRTPADQAVYVSPTFAKSEPSN